MWQERSNEQKIELLRDLVSELSQYVLHQPTSLLLQVLEKHQCEDDEEQDSVTLIKKMLREYPNLWFQSCEVGHITGSGLILDTTNKKFLLMHHKKLLRWLQMGGHGESELDPAHIALREAVEESGLPDLRFFPDVGYPTLLDVDAHIIPAGQNRPQHYHLDFRYAFYTGSPDQVRCLHSEAKDLRWFSFAEVADLDLNPSTFRLISKANRLMGNS
jgi:8-oxo-dGTP pyrophosphatase MutT (NUDIX family)